MRVQNIRAANPDKEESQREESAVFQELENIENFLAEAPEYEILQAVNYIFMWIRSNVEKIKDTDEKNLIQRFTAVLEKIKKYLQTPALTNKKQYFETMKNRHDIYFRDEETAKHLADNWDGTGVKKPQNLRFLENAIPVVLCANENYAPYMAVMLQSLLDNSNPQRKYHFIIFERNFSAKTKNYLINQVSKCQNCLIDFIDMTYILDGIPIGSPANDISIDAFSRLFIPYWFDRYPKVIYLDSDMICKTDIAELYDLDIQPFCMGAATDRIIGKNLKNKNYAAFLSMSAFILLDNWSRYFNSGTLVFDTEKFKEKISYQDLFRFAIYYTNRYAKRCNDQDVLNLLIKDDYFLLSQKWNYICCEIIDGMLKPAKPDVKIIHFACKKPWKNHPYITKNNSDALAYIDYAKNVPLYNINCLYK